MQKTVLMLALCMVAGGIALAIWAHRPTDPSVPKISGITTETAFKSVMTTYFFVGEPADASNNYIPNQSSYWDDAWLKHFGAVDSPDSRCGYKPCSITPRENPFYVALPYGEFTPDGSLKPSARLVPWFKDGLTPLLKNHWVEVVHGSHTCFGQWEDVGPNGENDFAYVFGTSTIPVNTFGEKAGLDVSPALWNCLGMTDNDSTSWRFVDEKNVSAGPWRDIVTRSPISWGN
jgi:hypothetical protein